MIEKICDRCLRLTTNGIQLSKLFLCKQCKVFYNSNDGTVNLPNGQGFIYSDGNHIHPDSFGGSDF